MTEPPLRGRHATLADALDAAAEQLADHEAYVEGDRRVTFGEWLAAADSVAAELATEGVEPGDVVAIMLPPSIDYAIAFAAIVKVGGIATGLNIRLGPREVEAIFDRAEPIYAFVPDGDLPAGLPAGLPTMSRTALGAASIGGSLGADRHRGLAEDPVTIVWTSGTTGMPKGAWFDHDGLRAAVHTAGVMTEPFDRRLMSVPFAHAGYMAKLWEQVAWATTLVISPVPWTAADTLRLLVDERITVGGGAPAQWAKLLEQPGLADADLSALRLGIAATAPAPPELIERVAEQIGCPLVVRYAMTESPSITGTDPTDPPEVQYRTVGRPQSGVTLSVRGEDGEPRPDGEIGRIFVKAGCVMGGYWRDAEMTAEAIDADGWLRSSDLGHIDPDGNLVLAGRLGDMYIRGGYNVHPLQVENVLTEHPAVDQAAVVGSPVPVLGEIGVAFVVVAHGAEPPTLAELRTWVSDRLADYKAPDRVEVVEALPLTALMKVDKLALKSRL